MKRTKMAIVGLWILVLGVTLVLARYTSLGISMVSDEMLYTEFANRTALMEKVTMDAKLVEPESDVAIRLSNCVVLNPKFEGKFVSAYFTEGTKVINSQYTVQNFYLTTPEAINNFSWSRSCSEVTKH